MSYLGIDTSLFTGKPVEVYRFTLGENEWLYTSGDRAVEALGKLYQPAAIKRSKIEISSEINRSSITLDVSKDFAPAQQWFGGIPDAIMGLRICRVHETDIDKELVGYWVGRVTLATFQGKQVQLTGEPIFSSLKRPGLRMVYQTSCRHVLYGDGCGLDEANFEDVANVDAISPSGNDITSTTFALQPDGYYTIGFVRLTGAINVQRAIIAHTGDTITLNQPITGLAVNDSLSSFPGCAHNLADCETKFNNLLNYGGFPWMPIKNPFAGDAIV